jgi:hypothetical protein
MRCEPACVTLVVLLAAQVAFADPLVPDSPLGCPPSKTETVNPFGNASLVRGCALPAPSIRHGRSPSCRTARFSLPSGLESFNWSG